ncbi:MAG: hypothetical protein WC694_01810 [Candidatus Paceibacterota bacterium]|jgi:hypothetical protein
MIKRTVFLISLALILIFGVVWGSHWATKWYEKKETKKVEGLKAKELTKTQPPATINSKGGKHKTLLVFLPNGCIAKHLQGRWERYPKGGKIKFLDSNGKVVLIDEPGTYVPSSLPAGEYKICKASPEAWGVEIWE